MAAERRLGFTRFVPALFCLLFLSVLQPSAPAAETRQTPNLTPILDPEKSGAELAARLRSALPPEPADEFKGNLIIVTRDDKVTTLPIISVINPADSNHWAVSYWALTPDSRLYEELVIDHTSGRSNKYRIYFETNHPATTTNRLTLDKSKLKCVELLSGDQLTRPFAGSDFWLCDLGLEFLHWPQQRVLKHEMRRSRSCWMLESVTPTPAPGGYARVLSWIDVEYEGILFAEAYDRAGNKMKDFKLGAFRKVDGSPKLESMKIRNLRTGSESELKFDLKSLPKQFGGSEDEKLGKQEVEETKSSDR
jgi:hypothetical protein